MEYDELPAGAVCGECGSDDIATDFDSPHRGECCGCGATVTVNPFDGTVETIPVRTMRAARAAEAAVRDVFDQAADHD